jgi:hypothetical protein
VEFHKGQRFVSHFPGRNPMNVVLASVQPGSIIVQTENAAKAQTAINDKQFASFVERGRYQLIVESIPALDLFDAASYPEPSMYDVAGAYQARLNEGMEAIGECTRKLREGGYRRIPGIIAIG